ncbi:methionine ABC transporter ATP-binding protein [Bacillus marinisedimentorum]|uniref:methionine ABC transporter ATP-binding protein n=1 Tax=Bacillus marinisedimentorum TaxID=1821260 RepID=UPI0008728E7D|nr:methionine ABC transporter ATP-binding protein [Bacillus marinisedimentorum]
MIQLSNIEKVFKSKKGPIEAVKDVNLTIQNGEIYGIIGYSGAGKSTLIRMLNGLEKPTGGTITVGDWNMNTLSGRELRLARQEIGMVFQHFNLLWSRTVYDNIAFPLEISRVAKKERNERVLELIRLVGLQGREDAYPSELSGGQKQRVGIARALANNPKVLLCDEATSALDPETTDSILDLLVDINERFGLTIVLITHEMHVIHKISHRVAVMENGRVVEEGNVRDVFRKPKQQVTRRFVKQVTEPDEAEETIEHLLAQYEHGKVIQLTFIGNDAEEPVINETIKKFEVIVNILQGKVQQTNSGTYGTLFVHFSGDDDEVNRAISHIRKRGVEAEVLQSV